MQKGSVLGYDLNEKNCQISYYDENKEEPETMEATVRIMTTPPTTPGMTQFFILFFFAISYLSRFVFYFRIPQSCVNEK